MPKSESNAILAVTSQAQCCSFKDVPNLSLTTSYKNMQISGNIDITRLIFLQLNDQQRPLAM
jgi:hypothetical protein